MNLLNLTVTITCDNKEALSGISSLSSAAVTKATAMGNLISDALKGAFSKVVDLFKTIGSSISGLVKQALGAFSTYEQLKGGVETLFKNASGQVLQYAQNAYKTAGLSANKYMETATSFASTLVQSLAKRHQQTVQLDIEAERAMLDQQLANEKAAMDAAYKEQQRIKSHEQTEFSRQQQDRYEEYVKSLNEELSALKSTNDQKVADTRASQEQEVKAFEDATNAKLKLMEKEYNESLKLIDEELYNRTKSIDKEIDALNAQTESEREQRKQREQQEKKDKLTSAVTYARTSEERKRAQEELNEFLEQLEQEKREKQRKSQIEELREQKAQLKEQASERKETLKEQYDQEVEQYRESRIRQEEELKASHKRELEEIETQNNIKYEKQREENEKLLKEYRRNQEDEMTAFRESQEDQLAAFRAAQDAQYEALKAGAESRLKQLEKEASAAEGFAEATEEDYIEAARLTNMAITDMADNANKYGTAMESLQFAYQGFSKQNFSMLDNLKLGYGGTKIEMERLLKDAEALKAKQGEVTDYSIDSMADIIEAIHTLQTEYGVSGYSIDELTEKLQTQSLTEQELHRISQDIYTSKANQYKSEEEAYNSVVEAYKNGSLDVKDALILTGTTSYEASQTVEGSINSLKGAWENWLVSLADDEWDVKDTTDKLVEAAGIAMENIVPRVSTILETLATVIQEKGPEALAKLKDAFLNSLPEEWRTKIKEFGKKLDEFIEKLEPIKTWLEENLPKAMDVFGDVLDSFTQEDGSGKVFLDFLKDLKETLEFLSLPLQALGEGLGYVAADIATTFDDTALNTAELEAVNKNAVDNMLKKWESYPEEIKQKFINADGTLTEQGQAIIDSLQGGAENQWEEKKSWWETIGDWIKDHKGPVKEDAQLLTENGSAIIEGLFSGASSSWGRNKSFFTNIAPWLSDVFGNSDSWLDDSGNSLMNGLNEGIGNGWRPVYDFFSSIDREFTGSFYGSIGWLFDSGVDLLNGLMDGLNNVWGSVRSFFGDIPNNIVNALGDVSNILWNAGSDIINGFWDGLSDTWNNVQTWFNGIGDWIVDNKGPEEYDKKLLVPAGQFIMQGFNKGLRSQIGTIRDTLDDVTGLFDMGQSISDSMTVQAAQLGNEGTSHVTGPQIVIQEMNVRSEQDIYDISDRLDRIWMARLEGSLV